MNQHHSLRRRLISGILLACASLLTLTVVQAVENGTQTITIELGDYRYSPDHIQLVAGTPVRLVLVNTDTVTPHNFTLQNEAGGLDIDVDVSAGKTGEIDFTPQMPGTYTFFCDKKMPFMKSHRDRGMQGKLVVTGAE